MTIYGIYKRVLRGLRRLDRRLTRGSALHGSYAVTDARGGVVTGHLLVGDDRRRRGGLSGDSTRSGGEWWAHKDSNLGPAD